MSCASSPGSEGQTEGQRESFSLVSRDYLRNTHLGTCGENLGIKTLFTFYHAVIVAFLKQASSEFDGVLFGWGFKATS
jgi:hypothetical protein